MATIASREPYVAPADPEPKSGRTWLWRFMDAVKRSRQVAAEREVRRLVEHDPAATVRTGRRTFV